MDLVGNFRYMGELVVHLFEVTCEVYKACMFLQKHICLVVFENYYDCLEGS